MEGVDMESFLKNPVTMIHMLLTYPVVRQELLNRFFGKVVSLYDFPDVRDEAGKCQVALNNLCTVIQTHRETVL